MNSSLRIFILFIFVLHAVKPSLACDNTPLLVVYDPVEIAGGQWNLDVFVCFGSTESEDGFTLSSTDGSIDILNATPSVLINPLNDHEADALFTGGVLNYYYDNSDGSNFNDATGETGPCVDFQITVDSDPTGTSFTMAGVNDGCDYTISDSHLTSEVQFTPQCAATMSMTAPGMISGNTQNAPTDCNFRSPVFSTVKENIIEVVVPCDGDYTFSLCGSSFDTWMAISYQCCFLPFVSNDNSCSYQSEISVELSAGTYYVLVEGFLWDDYGDYTLTVSSSTDAVSISNIEVVDPQCSGNDAEMIIHASGSDGPYSYSIDGGANFTSDSVFSGLSAGNYFILVQSQSGCTASELISVNTNPPLILDSVQNTPASCGLSNGELIINVSNGTAPYEYSLDNGSSFQLSNTFSGLSSGDYLVRVKDSNGCEVNTNITVDSSSLPIIQELIVSDASCGLATGMLEIIASGDSDLLYSIDGINFQSSNVFTGLQGGIYNASVQSALGCSVDSTISISDAGAPLFSQINLTASSCDSSGVIEMIVSGGGGNYLYSIDGGLTYLDSNVFDSLNSGNYTLSVIDDNLCVIDSMIYLDQNSSLSIDGITIVEASCDPLNGTISNNGSVDILASGGLGPISYSIDGGTSFQAASSFASLSYGAYSVVISDGTCSVDSLISLGTNPGPQIEILDARDLSCGEENGFIAVKVLNATDPDYIYQFENGVDLIQSPATTDDQYSYDQFSSGIWNVIVSDGNGCIADTAVELLISPDISINDILIEPVYCNQNDGAFTILASTGNLPIEYSFNSNFSNAQGNGFFGGLSAGSYTVYLRDDRLCLDTATVVLSDEGGVIIDSIASVNPSCLDHNGEITIYASQGSPPYYYSIDNGLSFQTGNFFSNLHDESYEILVIDANGCTAISEVSLVASDSISLTIETFPLRCGLNNGEITILASGGDGNFTYTIDNGSILSNNTGLFTDLSSGTYYVDVVDGQGCSESASAFLDSIPPPQIDSLSVTEASCSIDNGSIEIFVSGGTEPYQYSIDNGVNYSSLSLFNSLFSGTYQIMIQDSLQCLDSSTVVLDPSAQITIAALILSEPTCDDLSGSVIVIVEDAVAPVQFILNGVDTNEVGTFDNLNAGTYSLSVIDAQLCSADTVFTLVDNSTPNPPAICMPDFTSCSDSVLISASSNGSSMGLWTVISGAASIETASDSSTWVYGLSSGANEFVWTISNGICPPTADTLIVNLADSIIVDAGEDVYIVAQVAVPFFATANVQGTYLWTPAQYLNDPNISNPVAIVDASTQFIVSVTGEYNCFGADSVWIYFVKNISFPTAFTPNNDGNNDTWIIENIEWYPDVEVSIMNRYGNVVFESKGYSTPWDGTFNGNEVPVGSYFYIIDLGSDFEIQSGSITVIR